MLCDPIGYLSGLRSIRLYGRSGLSRRSGAAEVGGLERDLAAEAHVWLTSRPEGATFKEIAFAIRARSTAVRHVLRNDSRFIGPFADASRPRHHLYALAPLAGRQRLGTDGDRPSQCSRILAVLADRRPHTVTEIHKRAGTSRLNSRVAELRRQLRSEGLTIECTRELGGPPNPDKYSYQLKVAA